VRLFATTVKTTSPSKSWGEISIRVEGCDTPGVAVVATVLQQSLTRYLQCLDEIQVLFGLNLNSNGSDGRV
jgi:hypothetical protein